MRCYNIEDYEIIKAFELSTENWSFLLFSTATKDGLQMSGIAGMIERVAGVKMSWDLSAIMMLVFCKIKLSNLYHYCAYNDNLRAYIGVIRYIHQVQYSI